MMPHRGQDIGELNFVVPDICRLFYDLHHKYDGIAGHYRTQRRQIERQLIAQHGNERCHNRYFSPKQRQRCEQNLTSSQSRAHFLRHANGRWQEMHILVGKVDL